jgi:uncharacterized cupin superfamily protein
MTLPVNVLRASALGWEEGPGNPRVEARIGWRSRRFDALPLRALGAHLQQLMPGLVSAPLHHHLLEEEHFYLLEGELVVRELASGAGEYREYPLRPGELVAYPAGTGLAHHFHNRGTTPATFVALSDQREGEICAYPDSGKVLLTALGKVGVLRASGERVDDERAFARAQIALANRAAGARSMRRVIERPDHVADAERCPERAVGAGFGRPLARVAGARSVFVNEDRLPPGATSSPLHWHTADEELVIVLEGAPTLSQVREDVEEIAQLIPGDVVHWAPGDRVAHHLVNRGREDARLLVIGTDRPEDLCVFPERGYAFSRLLGRRVALAEAGFWDGEADPHGIPESP